MTAGLLSVSDALRSDVPVGVVARAGIADAVALAAIAGVSAEEDDDTADGFTTAAVAIDSLLPPEVTEVVAAVVMRTLDTPVGYVDEIARALAGCDASVGAADSFRGRSFFVLDDFEALTADDFFAEEAKPDGPLDDGEDADGTDPFSAVALLPRVSTAMAVCDAAIASRRTRVLFIAPLSENASRDVSRLANTTHETACRCFNFKRRGRRAGCAG